jgi:gas vesicle protein
MNGERQPPIFLLTGLVIGVVLGLVYAWVFTPVETVETNPSTLSDDYKDSYRELIAVAYTASGDLGRAESRLALLGDEDPARALIVQAQLTLGEEGSESIAQALGALAAELSGDSETLPTIDTGPTQEKTASKTATSDAPTTTETPPPTATATATRTATKTPEPGETITPDEADETSGTQDPIAATATNPPTQIPSPTAGASFTLLEIALDCGREYNAPLIQVYTLNAANAPVPGVQIVVTWDDGVNTFYTGFKPELGLGYADFEMTPEIIYILQLTEGDKPVTGLAAQECQAGSGERYWGSWRLTFKQP